MKILGIDASALVASVAIVEDGILLGEYTVNHKKTHSQTLMPMLDELVRMTEFDMREADAFAIAAGPGSFTGLRIGSAAVKGLAFAYDKPVVEVPTLDALAYTLWGSTGIICPIMDARRGQVYTGVYSYTEGRLNTILEQCPMDIMDLCSYLNEQGERVTFNGDGVPVYMDVILENMKIEPLFAPANRNRQSAAAVAALGEEYFRQGKTVSGEKHVPVYLRQSQAEREKGVNGK